jgi:hypothetical protein
MGMYAAIFTLHILLLRFFCEKFVNRSMNLYGYDFQFDQAGTLNNNNIKAYF